VKEFGLRKEKPRAPTPRASKVFVVSEKNSESSHTSASDWQDFHSRFLQLAKEEEANPRAIQEDRLLSAYCDYKKHPEIWAEKGKPEQAPFCLLKAPETGLWIISDGMSENFQARFRALAARAGVALSSPQGADAWRIFGSIGSISTCWKTIAISFLQQPKKAERYVAELSFLMKAPVGCASSASRRNLRI
jgi:hypothetical protein